MLTNPAASSSRGLCSWALAQTFGWFDFAITVDRDAVFEDRFAEHLENEQCSFSDPAWVA